MYVMQGRKLKSSGGESGTKIALGARAAQVNTQVDGWLKRVWHTKTETSLVRRPSTALEGPGQPVMNCEESEVKEVQTWKTGTIIFFLSFLQSIVENKILFSTSRLSSACFFFFLNTQLPRKKSRVLVG